MKFEQVESPEYIKYCEENKQRYIIGVDVINGFTKYKDFGDSGDREIFITLKHHSMFDNALPIPYKITSKNGTYKTPIQKHDEYWKNEVKEGRLKLVFLDMLNNGL